MARKKPPEEHENHERWLVSYADFITLLFAFFVVMYAISSINEGKYRVLSESLITAFKEPPQRFVPIQSSEASHGGQGILQHSSIRVPMPRSTDESYRSMREARAQALKKISEEIERAVSPLIRAGVIDVRRSESWIEVEIKAKVLFASASADLTDEAVPILSSLAEIVKGTPYRVNVEGFTDNEPIYTARFPSNWELSAQRAGAVVRLFEERQVDPAKMAVIGHGAQRPKVSNDTPEGREKNRRVVLVIASDEEERRRLEAERAAQLDQEMEAARNERAAAQEPEKAPAKAEALPPPPIPILSEPVVHYNPDGSPVDVTERAVTDVGIFPVIKPPIVIQSHEGTQ
ncbi:hypothetical protein JCM17961_09170 [Endothiovibrio diazotrophicus]